MSQGGRRAAPLLSYTMGGRQRPEGRTGILTQERLLLNPPELPQSRIDYSIIFRHMSLLNTSQSDTGVLNFPTGCTAETGTWNVF